MPVVRWRTDGGGKAIVAELDTIIRKRKELTETEKENVRESKRLDRVAKQIIKGQTSDLKKFEQAVADVVQVQKTQRGVTKQMADNELRRLKQEYLENARAADKLKRSNENAFGATAVSNLKNYVLTAFGVGSAVAAAQQSLQALIDTAARAGGEQVSAAQSRRGLKFNLSGATPAVQRSVLASANRLAPQLGLQQQLVDQTIASAVSAAPTVSRGVRFAEFGLRAFKDLEGSDELIGGGLDIANALGTDDPREAFGFLATAILRSRATDPRKFAANAPRTIAAGQSLGLDPATAVAFQNAISVAAADKDLEVSRTASINVFDRAGARFFTPDRIKQLGATPESLDTLPEQLQFLLANPNVSKQFVDETGFRAAGIGGIRGILQGLNAQSREAFDLTVAGLSDRDALVRAGGDLSGFLNTGRFEGAANLSRGAATAAQQTAFSSRAVLDQQGRQNLFDALLRGENVRSAGRPFGNLGNDLSVSAEMLAVAGFEIDTQEAVTLLQRQIRGINFGLANDGFQLRDVGEAQQIVRTLQEIKSQLEQGVAAQQAAVNAAAGGSVNSPQAE